MKFYILENLEQAEELSFDEITKYSAFEDKDLRYLLYDESIQRDEEIEHTVDLTVEQVDGLTPINPSKPMFPKK